MARGGTICVRVNIGRAVLQDRFPDDVVQVATRGRGLSRVSDTALDQRRAWADVPVVSASLSLRCLVLAS